MKLSLSVIVSSTPKDPFMRQYKSYMVDVYVRGLHLFIASDYIIWSFINYKSWIIKMGV